MEHSVDKKKYTIRFKTTNVLNTSAKIFSNNFVKSTTPKPFIIY